MNGTGSKSKLLLDLPLSYNSGLKVLSVFGVNDLLLFVCFVRQKLAVRSCPVGIAAKPLALIKPPSQSIAISVVPAKTPVSMVTAHINGQKALQTSPINLQTPAGQHISRSQVQLHNSILISASHRYNESICTYIVQRSQILKHETGTHPPPHTIIVL